MLSRRFQFNRFSIRGLFGPRARIAAIGLILVVPFMLERVWTLEASRVTEIRRASAELLHVARHSADAQREVISSVEALLRSAAYIHLSAGAGARGCAIIGESFYVEMPWILNLAIAGKDGRILCSTTSSFVGLNVEGRDYFESAINSRRFVISSTVVNKLTQRPTMIAAYASQAASPDDVVVVMASINMQWLAQMLEKAEPRPGLETLLVDSKGMILATRASGFRIAGTMLDDNEFIAALSAAETGSITSVGQQGVRKITSFARVTGTDMYMVARVDEKRMLQPIDTDIRWAYGELALVSLLVMFVTALCTELFAVRPLRELTRTVTRFGMGDLAIPARPKGFLPPILEPLAKAFDDMARQLAERERQLRSANNQLAVLASVDTVSGLANRRGFDSRLDFEWMKGEQTGASIAFLMIDVDFFKLFNDTYGHLEGDECLRRISGSLADIANQVNGFVGRYGGEEFSMLLPEVSNEQAIRIAEQVRAEIEQLGIAHKASPNGHVTVSIGVAHAHPGHGTVKDLVEAADAGLYAAKRRGRNAVVEHGAVRAVEQNVALAS